MVNETLRYIQLLPTFSVCFENDVSILYVLLNTGHIITKNNIREILVIPLKK
jgi:hypothetical protein